ncbi:hypothetical protein BuS5_01771 [Desulfosarcina sp. BuS5]|uniref:hypothetical protein n=1 Tax=Desulfosarcina sp. BuS5 TaxID=933262 RepID=UPI00048674C3|nr:hypothetical protein [Desulfosarcina sp. BuS5]WDN88803.1 hypothetical protein BuS5_01771 [Desulfosarcina sp. BuS5]
MNLTDQYFDRAHEIIGERTPEEKKYDNEVLLWLEKTGKIRKAINTANKKHPNEMLQYNEDNIADIQEHYEYLVKPHEDHKEIG